MISACTKHKYLGIVISNAGNVEEDVKKNVIKRSFGTNSQKQLKENMCESMVEEVSSLTEETKNMATHKKQQN